MLLPLPLLLVSLNIPKMTYNGSLRPLWRLKFLFPLPLLLPLSFQVLPPPRSLDISHWRPVPRTYIAKSPIWTTITFVSNMRTILLPLELRGLTKSLLPYFSFETRLVFVGDNTNWNETQTILSRWHKTKLRHSFIKAWVPHKSLWTLNRKRLRGISSTSQRKSLTRQSTWSTCKRSSQSLI